MKYVVHIFVAALALLAPAFTVAHEVPDRVNIGMIVRQDPERLVILVRVPANALIDILLPTLNESNWVDLANAGPLAIEGANTWVADILRFRDGERRLRRPEVMAVRLSRLNDPAFRDFDSAYARINGPALSNETLALQEDLTVDVMLQTPISADPHLFFEPRFARLGVTVETTLKFLPLAGGIREFRYESDPSIFELDPGMSSSLALFSQAGFAHFFDETDYLLLALVIALVFQTARRLVSFAIVLAAAQALALFVALFVTVEPFWLRGLCGTAIAAAIVFLGCESITAASGRRRALAIVVGVIFGYGFWIGLQPIIQFGGSHDLASVLGFIAGTLAAQCLALLTSAAIVRLVLWTSRSPRRATMVVAAFAIHIAWRRFLDRADALALMPSEFHGIESRTLATIAAILAVMFGVAAFYKRRLRNDADKSASI